MNIKSYFPILDSLHNYNSKLFRSDLSAGITVGVMLIPQGMAYAMIAGLPPIYGLYASVFPLLVYALLGTSRQLAVGPVAMVSLLTASSVSLIAETGTDQYILLAITLALLVGLIQFLLGAFRLGFLVNFLSHPVISGFTSAAALIIGFSQLKHLLGIDIPRSHHVHEIIFNAVGNFGQTNWYSLGIGLGGIVIIKAIKRINKALPSQLVAVVFGIVVVWMFALVDKNVKIVGDIPSGLPSFSMPSFSMSTWESLTGAALAIALVSFMESIAVAKAIQAKHKNYKIDANQELIALGMANIIGSFFKSYPVTGGFSRTAVNDQAGARTTIAMILSVILIVLTLIFLTPLFYYLPKTILASVIMVAVFGLIDYKEAIHLWHTDRKDFTMLAVSFMATLFMGIEQGIAIGVLLSLVVLIFNTSRPHIAILGRLPGSDVYRNIERFEEAEQRKEYLIIRFDGRLYFANSEYFRDRVEKLAQAKGFELEAIIINGESINSIDSTALHMLKDLFKDLSSNGIRLIFTGLIGPVRDIMKKAGLFDAMGENSFYLNINSALKQLDSPEGGFRPMGHLALQSNKK